MPTPGQAPLGSLLEEAPIAMLGVDQAGVIVFVNQLTEQMFGYERDELVGEPVEALMPESFRTAHTRQRAGHFAHPVSRKLGASRELKARRRDGTEFPAEISLSSAIETEDGVLVTAAIRDTTERNRVDQDLKRLAAIVRDSEDAIVGKTLDGIITSWNPAAERMYGYSGEEIIGKGIELIAGKDRSAEMKVILEKVRHGERAEKVDTIRIHKDGTAFPVVLTVSPIRDAIGVIIGSSTIARDVTEQTQAFDAARGMIESSLDALVAISPEGMITDANEATIRVTGVGREALIGTAFSDYFTESDKANEIYQRVFADGMAVDYEMVMRHRDGTLTDVLYNASVYRDIKGNVLGVFAAARDVTKQVQAFDAARGMIESSLDALVAISPEGMITDANEATIRVTGVGREALIGTAFSDYFTESDKANEIYQRVFADGMAVDYPLTMRHRDGTLTDVLYNASVYRDIKGKVLGVFAAARDVTKQMRAQREMARQQAREMDRLAELERFQRLTVGRELKMIELKKEVESLRRLTDAGAGESDDWR